MVLVIGFAAALVVIGEYSTTADSFTGWTGYAPLSVSGSPFVVPGGVALWVRLVVWLALVAIWVAGSLPLRRSPPRTTTDTPDPARAKDAPGSPA